MAKNEPMIKYETRELEKFLLEIDGRNYYFQPDGTPTPADKITLYNPLLPLHTLFHVFEYFRRPTRRLDNVVDKALLKEGFDCEHRHSTQYFFQVPVPGFHVSVAGTETVSKTFNGIEKNKTMTATEAILYLLFYQFKGDPQPLPCPIVTLTRTTSMNIPLIVGFDEEDICNKVQLYNSGLSQSIATKEVYTRQ